MLLAQGEIAGREAQIALAARRGMMAYTTHPGKGSPT